MAQAKFRYDQGRLGEAKSEALRAADVFEKLGAAEDLEECRDLLRGIERRMTELVNPDDESSDDDGDTGDRGPNTHWVHGENIESTVNM